MVDYYVKKREDAERQSEEEIVCWCWNIAKWKQLDVWAWKPILDETYVIVILFAITALFLPVALYIRHENQLVHQFSTRYDNVGDCASIESGDYPGNCTVTIDIGHDMTPPVFFYYEVREFYQTHRLYVQSREEDQLTGEDISKTEQCKEKSTGKDGKTLVPCGLVAYSFFNDKFQAELETYDGQRIDLCPNCTELDQWADPQTWSAEDIAWDWDQKKFKYKELGDSMTAISDPLGINQNRSLPRVDNEDFIVWMRPAVSKNFKKLHRKLLYTEPGETTERGLKEGDKLHVNVRTWFRVHGFSGEKHVVVSDVSRLGGKNSALWIMYLNTGILSFCVGFFFLATFYRHVSQQERIKLNHDRRESPSSPKR